MSCVVGVVISMWRTKTVVVTIVKEKPVEHVAPTVAAKSVTARLNHEVISFKDDGPQDIRIKLL